jgi:hypothetical protein
MSLTAHCTVSGGVASGTGDEPFEDRGDRDDGLLLVGSLSVNDLNMSCPNVTR